MPVSFLLTWMLTIMIVIISMGEGISTFSRDYIVPANLFQEIDTDQGLSMSVATASPFVFWLSKEFLNGFTSSMAMILATEIGDKTFFIAAVLSMRNSRTIVFTGAFLALFCMTILSTILGLILPSFFPREYVDFIGGVLFLYFGIRLIYDSRSMQNTVSDDLEEVEGKLLYSHKKNESDNSHHVDNSDMESGSTGIIHPIYINDAGNETNCGSECIQHTSIVHNKIGYRVFLQSLILTFLAEWGDRSQIATIALAASKDPLGVTFGACIGHFVCTGMAVIGGRILASRISEKSVTLWGGITFLAFGLHPILSEYLHELD